MVVSGADDQMHVVDGSEEDVLTEAEPSPSLMHYFLVEAWVIHPEVVEALLDEKRWE